MLMSKNVNNDVSKDLPITEATEMIQMINPGLKQSLLSCVRKMFPLCHNSFTPETFLQIHISCTLVIGTLRSDNGDIHEIFIEK